MERQKVTLSNSKTILITPLDWGLGHATRCIPLIDLLIQKNHRVIIAGNGDSFYLLKEQYPELTFYELPGYNISYAVGKNASVHALLQTPKILKIIREENKLIADILQKEKVDLIISDNRYGVRNEKVKSIFICHQIALQAPNSMRFMNPVFLKLHLRQIHKFDVLWIPDEAGQNNLTGILNWGVSIKGAVIRHIGLLSRFQQLEPEKIDPDLIPVPDILAMISGPEPQRKRFEKLLIRKLSDLPYRSVILQGIPSASEIKKAASNVWLVSHLSSRQMLYLMKEASLIIARGGYSTIMDLRVLEKKAVLVPTPGQPEQEYLCSRMQQLGYFTCIKQSEFGNIKILLTEKCRDRNSTEEKT